jgi:hypothetical protein
MRANIFFVAGLFLGLCCAFWIQVQGTIAEMEYEKKLSVLRNDALEANQLRDQLLSNGRFIRAYNQKTNNSYYTFRPSK